jgi:hypothetical protein
MARREDGVEKGRARCKRPDCNGSFFPSKRRRKMTHGRHLLSHYNKGREPTLIERRLKADGLLRNFNYATTC